MLVSMGFLAAGPAKAESLTSPSDPFAPASIPGPFEILNATPQSAFGGWRITWSSIPGRAYRLQFWTSGELGIVADPPWTDVATVQAQGPTAFADDPTSVAVPRRFYRVMLLEETSQDLTGPTVSAIESAFTTLNNQPAARLRVRAQDPSGVARVIFLNGTQELGEAVRGPRDQWIFTLPLDVSRLGARFLVARAIDSLGNVSHSPTFPLGLVDPDHFAPLDAGGNPIPGGVVQALAPGQWGPVEYRPGGRNLLGLNAAFFIRFPNGVRLVRENEEDFLEFTDAIAGFGPDYPLQLDRLLTKTGGEVKRLRVGPVDFNDLAEIFSFDPQRGLRVTFVDRFPLLWKGGILEEGGIRAARFGFDSPALQLPDSSGNYPGFTVDFTRSLGLRIPFHGELTLPDGSATPSKLRIGLDRPLWLTLHPDGRLSLTGGAEARLANGGFFRVDVRLDDPFYRLQIAGDRVHLPALGSLADLLPASAETCLPVAATAAQLDQAARCLAAYAHAYLNFSGAVASMSPADDPLSESALIAPPEPFDALAAVLDAWTFSALARPVQQLPLDALRDLMRQFGRSASGAGDLETVLAYRLALVRAKNAAAQTQLTGSAEARADLDAALAEAENSAVQLARDPGAVVSLESLRRAVRMLIETEALRQEINLPAGPLLPAATELLTRFANQYAANLGVQPGAFLPGDNPAIAGMNRFAAAESVRVIIELMADAQLLGVNLNSTLLDEALGQLAVRLFEAAEAAADAAEAAGDYPGFLFALQDLVDLVAHRELAVFPNVPALQFLPDVGDLPGYPARLDALLLADLEKPMGERSFANLAAEIRALLRILRSMPATVTFASPPFQRAYAALEQALAAATTPVALAAQTRLPELLDLLEAGALHAELGRRFNLPAPVSWESQRLPLVVAAIAETAQSQGAWSELNQAVRFLLQTADGLDFVGDQILRRAYLNEAANLLNAARSVARSLIQTSNPLLQAADMLLPGDIHLDDVAGSIRYSRFTGEFAGSFRGSLRLPKFGTALTIRQASFGSGGRFAIDAFGQLTVPAGSPVMTGIVPESNPLRLSWTPEEGLRLSGAASVTLANGMFFKARLGLEDPLYYFGLEAGGLELRLIRELAQQIPELPSQAALTVNGRPDETGLELWADLYGGFASTVAAMGLSGPVDPLGEGADETPNDPAIESLRTWSALIALGSHHNNLADYTATIQPAAELLLNESIAANDQIRQFATEIDAQPSSGGGTVTPPPPPEPPAFTRALQIDFGMTPVDPANPLANLSATTAPFIGFVNGPAQEYGRSVPGTGAADIALPGEPGRWNFVGTADAANSLFFADGSPAAGIQVDLGLSPGNSSSTVIDWAVQPRITQAKPADLRGGVYDTTLMRDRTTGHPLNPASGSSSLGVRVRNLSPGYYEVFAMISGEAGDPTRFAVFTGTNPNTFAAFPGQLLTIPAEPPPDRGWLEGVNFVRAAVELTQQGQDLVVVSVPRPHPADLSGSARAGELNGLQIVAPRVRFVSFTASPERIAPGDPVTLRWEIGHAQELTLTGTDGTQVQVTGNEFRVTPASTTIYTLTARNANGPPVSGQVRVEVGSRPIVVKNTVQAGLVKQRIDTAVRKALEELAECSQSGREDCVLTNRAEIQRQINEFHQQIREKLLNCAEVKAQPLSLDSLIQAAAERVFLVLDEIARTDLSTFEAELTPDEAANFAGCIAEEYANRTGFVTERNQNGVVTGRRLEPDVVNAFQVAESTAIIRNLLDLEANLQSLGSPVVVIHAPHLLAHATNIATRIKAAVGPDGTGTEDELESELSSYVTGIRIVNDVFSTFDGDLSQLFPDTFLLNVMNGLQRRAFAELDRFENNPLLRLATPRFWERQFLALKDIALINSILSNRPFADEIQSFALRIAQLMAEEADSIFDSNKDLRPQDRNILAFISDFLPDPAFRQPFESRIVHALEFLAAQVSPGTQWSFDEFRRSPEWIADLADLQVLIKRAGEKNTSIALPPDLQPLTLGTNLIAFAADSARRFASEPGAAAALHAFNKAIFAASRKIKLNQIDEEDLGSPQLLSIGKLALAAANDADPVAEALVRQSYLAIEAAAELAEADRQRLAQAPANLLPDDLQLPGSLRVERVFGELFYNRLTGFLQGGFGGRLSFPDTGMFFEIGQARIANDGSFSIAAATGTPLPFGRARLNAALSLDSAPDGVFTLSGDAQLLLPSNTSTQIFNLSVDYDQAARSFAFLALEENLNLKFTDDFVLFDAGLGFEVSSAQRSGRFTVIGSAGMFARNKPLPDFVSRTDFHLVADGITTSFTYSPEGVALSLANGTLRLPETFSSAICPANPPGGASGPAIALSPAEPISVIFRENPESVSFSGALALRNLGFHVPGITNLAVEVCSARLVFPPNRLPWLTNLNATLQLPIPNQTNRIDLLDAAFSLDGFPTGTIALRDNLPLFNQGGFEFTLLGSVTTNCTLPTALTIARRPNGQPFFQLDGGIEFAVPPSALGNTNGGRLFARSCGFFALGPNEPARLQMENFALGGTMRLGGPQGLLIDNALLALDGLTNLFNPTPERPFTITLAGAVNIPNGPRLALQDAKFTFAGETLPRFTVAGLSIAQNPDYEAAPGLLLNVTAASVVFVDPNRPFPEILAPDNIELGLSAQLNIPPGPEPILSGRVDNLRARIENGSLRTELGGFGIGIQNLEFPPLSLTGEVYLGGLDTVSPAAARLELAGAAPPGRPPGLFFAGRVGGTLNDVRIKALVAFDLQGPIGVCLDANAGPAGIPLGPTGFLLTGVAGGVSFLNSNSDPCDFTAFYPVGADGRPVAASRLPLELVRNRPGAAMTWEEYREYLRRAKLNEQAAQRIAEAAGPASIPGPRPRPGEEPPLSAEISSTPPTARAKATIASPQSQGASRAADDPWPALDLAGFPSGANTVEREFRPMQIGQEEPEFPCPTGDCPPPTVNLLCQPHPDSVQFPNRIILKFSSLDEQTVNTFGVTREFLSQLGLTDARSIGAGVAEAIRFGIDPLIPRADPALLGQEQAAQINSSIRDFLDDFEIGLAELLRSGLAAALGDADSIYEKVLEVAYAGVPCLDATVKLTGTFSHAAVSAALSATGGVVLSTAGAAGLVGSINVLGIPVGRTESFVAGTDRRGDPNPSFCGETLLAVGPLEFGQLKSLYECPGCITGLLASFGQLTGCLADETIRAILARVAPQHLNLPTPQALAALNDAEKIAFIGQVFSLPPVPGLGDCFVEAARTAVDSFNPFFTLCGQAAPKLFGIPLSGDLVSVNAFATRTELAGGFSFSPSFVINNLLLCAGSLGLACQPIFPALDSASMGFRIGFPDFGEAVVAGLEGKFNSPEALANFAKEGFDHMLANATYTIGYEINPFGFKLADAEARVILPNLTEHPARPGFTYVRPEDRGFPSRLTVALAALERGFLAQPLWGGTEQDLPLVFEPGSPERTQLEQARLSFQKDYFPHGGILGAARLAMPKLIVDPPPASLNTLLDPAADLFTRLGAAADVIGNYLLDTSEVGSLAFYVPAPNPPFFTNAEGESLTPEELLAAITTFDVANIRLQSLYPLEQFFFSGYMEGRLLGIPVGRADIVAVPASANSSAFFRVSAGIPSGSWLRSFVDNASLVFEIRQSPPLPIEQFFTELLADVNEASRPGANPSAVQNVVNGAVNSIADALPKVSLDISVNNFRIPDPLTNLLTSASTTARLVAYSPRFNPDFPGEGPIATVTRRGGVAVQGRFNFANLVTIDDAQLAVFPSDFAALPALAGRFRVSQLGIPGAALHDAEFDFNTAPGPDEPFLAASGALDPIHILVPLTNQRLLSIVPLAPGADRIGASFSMKRGPGTTVQGALSIDPARITMALLGPSVSLRIHGATPDQPFSFATDDSWSASATVSGEIVIPNLEGGTLATISAGSEPFSASISGNGLALTSLEIVMPTSVNVTMLPGTPRALSFFVGASSNPARLRVNGDGTFEFIAGLSSNLSIPFVGIPNLGAGASITLNQSLLRLTGSFTGGALSGIELPSANGTLEITSAGTVSLTGQATIPPIVIDRFRIRGANSEQIVIQLNPDGFSVPTGARFTIDNLVTDVLTLGPFTNRANGDFSAVITSGSFNVPDHFRITGGSMKLERLNNVATLEVNSPAITLMPGSGFETSLQPLPNRMIVSSNGRFYIDTGTRTVGLPGTFAVQGRVEIGNEPTSANAALTLSTTSINFGTIDEGTVSSRTVTLNNTGQVPLTFSLNLPQSAFTMTPVGGVIPVGGSQVLTARFAPATAGTTNIVVELISNAPGAPRRITLSGTGRAAPIYSQSAASLAFGERRRGSSTTREVTILNLGSAPMTLSGPAISAPFSFSPAFTTRTVNPGDSFTLQITFAPSAVGTFNSALTFSAGQLGNKSVALSGTAFDNRWVIRREGGPALHAIAWRDANVGFAVGDEGVFLRTEDGGRSWGQRSVSGGADLRTIVRDGNVLFAAGPEGTVFRSVDNGETWGRITSSLVSNPARDWRAAAVVNGSVILAGQSGTSAVMVRQSTSTTFLNAALPSNTPGLNAIAVQPGTGATPSLVAVGNSGAILISTNSGANWTRVPLPASIVPAGSPAPNLFAAAISASGQVLIAGERGLILRGTVSQLGATLTRSSKVPTQSDLRAIVITPGTGGLRPAFAAGDGGVILAAQDTTLDSWSSEDPPSTENLQALAVSGGSVWTVGTVGQILQRPSAVPTTPLIAWSAPELDFETLAPGAVRRLFLDVFNRGPVALNVSSISVPAPFTVSPGQAANILPNGFARLTVGFSSTNRGDFTGAIRMVHNDPGTPAILVPVAATVADRFWFPVESGLAGGVADVQFLNDTVGYAGGAEGVLKTMDGGLTWIPVLTGLPSDVDRVAFVNSTTGWAVGGFPVDPLSPCSGPGCSGFIRRTTDGGVTWTAQSPGIINPIADFSAVNGSVAFAIGASFTSRFTGSPPNIQPVVEPGRILRTANGGSTWQIRNAPNVAGTFSPTAIHAAGSDVVYLAANGRLWRSANGAGSWTSILDVSPATIRDIFPRTETMTVAGTQISADKVWAVTSDGRVHFSLVGVNPLNGQLITSFQSRTLNASADLFRVHFADGNNGWAVGVVGSGSARRSVVFRSRNGGGSWETELDISTASNNQNLYTVFGRSGGRAYAAGASGTTWTLGPVPSTPRGSPAYSSVVDFPSLRMGGSSTVNFTIRNIGTAALVVSEIDVENDDASEPFQLLTSGPLTIPANGTAILQLRFTATRPGRHHAVLRAQTDGFETFIRADLRGRVEVSPVIVTFQTKPTGLDLILDSVRQQAPIVRNVVPAPASNEEWEPGSSHRIEAPVTQTVGGITYRFDRWLPGGPTGTGNTFIYTATDTAARFTAVYVPVEPARSGPVALAASDAPAVAPAQGPPPNLPGGPYIRISNARLTVPGLGGLDVQGALFANANEFTAGLQSGPIGVDGFFEATAGSWSFEFRRNEHIRLRASSPSMEILNTPLTPPSSLLLNFQANGNFTAGFSTDGDLRLIPDVFELGPGSIAVSRSPFLSLSVDGQIRALRKPDGGFAIVRDIPFNAQEGPFTFVVRNLPSTILDVGLMRITNPGNAAVTLSRAANGSFGLTVSNFRFNVLGGAPTTFSGGVQNGVLSFNAGRSIGFGPFTYEAPSDVFARWRMGTLEVSAALPDGKIRATGIPGWPGTGIDFRGFTIDSTGNFDITVPLPTFSLNGIDYAAGGPVDHNQLRFSKSGNLVRVRVKDRRSFFGSTSYLSLNASGNLVAPFNPGISGSYTSSFGVDTPIGHFEFASVSMSYFPSRTSNQFESRFRAFGLPWRAAFGSNGASLCGLSCDGDEALGDCSLAWCIGE